MKHVVYFLRGIAALLLLIAAPVSSFSQEEDEILLKETTLKAGEELKLPVDCNTFVQVDFTAKNLVEEEAVMWHTLYLRGEELPEGEIGPLKFRTVNLGAKSGDKNKETITLDCSNMDELLFHVVKGKVHLTVIGRTSY